MTRSDLLILTVTLLDGSTWTTALHEVGEITTVMSRRGYERLKARVDRWTPTGFRNETEATMHSFTSPVVGWKHVESFEWPNGD